MPRYFFHVRNHVHTRDTEGTELADVAAARHEALADIEDIKRSEFDNLDGHWDGWSIEVCDEDDLVLLIVPLIGN
jgi:hypothetical protein